MANNVSVFRMYLQEKEVYMEEGTNEDGTSFFRLEQRLKNGGSVVLAIGFDESEEIIDLYVFNVADIVDAYKRESTLKLINELNRDLRYSKFTLDDSGRVTSNYCMMFEDNFNPDVLMRQLVLALNCVEEVYPKFMKIVWS